MSAIQAGKLFILQTHMQKHACAVEHIQHIYILAPALPLHAQHFKTSGLTDEFYEPNQTGSLPFSALHSLHNSTSVRPFHHLCYNSDIRLRMSPV